MGERCGLNRNGAGCFYDVVDCLVVLFHIYEYMKIPIGSFKRKRTELSVYFKSELIILVKRSYMK